MEKSILKDLYCFQCSLPFYEESAYVSHLSIFHKFELSNNFDFENKTNLSDHELTSCGPSKSFIVNEIKNESEEKLLLVSEVKPFKCNLCNDSFALFHQLSRHFTLVHSLTGDLNMQIHDTKDLQKENFSVYVGAIDEDKKTFEFENNFTKKENLKTKNQEEKKSFKCDTCYTFFSRKGVLKRHIETVHEGKKPFICGYCNASFTQKGDLKRHVLSVHEGVKPFKCVLCDKGFTLKHHLNQHLGSVHEGRKPFKCEICQASFAQKGALKKHIVKSSTCFNS